MTAEGREILSRALVLAAENLPVWRDAAIVALAAIVIVSLLIGWGTLAELLGMEP